MRTLACVNFQYLTKKIIIIIIILLVSTYDECFSYFKGGIVALAKVEEAYRHEKETKEAIEEVIRSCSLYQLQDTLDAADEGTDENRMLPAMNKIWPFLVVCIRNRNPVVRDHTYPWIVDMN